MILAADAVATSFVVLLAMIVVFLALGAPLFCVLLGIRKVWGRPPQSKRNGILLMTIGTLLPIIAILSPSVIFRLQFDNPPVREQKRDEIKDGMTAEEVRSHLGNPHQVNGRGSNRECWLYYSDAMQLGWFGVSFGNDGKVSGTYN